MEKKNIIIFIIFIIVISIVILTIGNYIKKTNEVNNLNNMYKDIDTIEENIRIYYLDNSSLPIKENSIDFKNGQNPNDDSMYYEIDLSLLGNLSLAYGRKRLGEDDIYIINQNSHTIYYYKGIEYNKEIYYTKKSNFELIDLEKYK